MEFVESGRYNGIDKELARYPTVGLETMPTPDLQNLHDSLKQEKLRCIETLEALNEFWEAHISTVEIDSLESNDYAERFENQALSSTLVFSIAEWTFLSELDRRMIPVLQTYGSILRKRQSSGQHLSPIDDVVSSI